MRLHSQDKLLQLMLKRYGTEANFVRADVCMTAREVESYCGPRCKDYEPDCVVCQAWHQWNRTGRCPVLVERDDMLKLLGIHVPTPRKKGRK